jgi:hypothetical protein
MNSRNGSAMLNAGCPRRASGHILLVRSGGRLGQVRVSGWKSMELTLKILEAPELFPDKITLVP